MTNVAILPLPTATGRVSYHAVAGDKRSHGNTAGEALDALTVQLSEEETGMLVIIQTLRPDRFFTVAQQEGMGELMALWRTARDKGESLSPETQAKLEALVETELRASADRTAAIADELQR